MKNPRRLQTGQASLVLNLSLGRHDKVISKQMPSRVEHENQATLIHVPIKR